MLLAAFNRALKTRAVPQPLRHALVKFYLLNIDRRQTSYSRRATSEQMRDLLGVWDLIIKDHGWMRSLLASECLDAGGNPIPWYTLPAIEYLSKLDWGGADVFEYGSGNSTLWWAARAGTVTSVESDRGWFERMKGRTPENCRLHFETDPEKYAGYIEGFEGFDVVVVDGIFLNYGRRKCAERALAALRPGGLIVLDNSDWLPRSAALLRDAGLLEVDMAGIAPLNTYACTTSLFFKRDFQLRPLSAAHHPTAAVGGVTQNWEDPDHEHNRGGTLA